MTNATNATSFPTATFSLSRFIEDAREVVAVAGRIRHEGLPDGRTSLVFRVMAGGGGDSAPTSIAV